MKNIQGISCPSQIFHKFRFWWYFTFFCW